MTISVTSYLETQKPLKLRAPKAILLNDLDLHIAFSLTDFIDGCFVKLETTLFR